MNPLLSTDDKLRTEINVFTNAVLESATLKNVNVEDRVKTIQLAEALFFIIMKRNITNAKSKALSCSSN